ncbi:hypothetical protein NQ315_000662 [Exocentrus adspersus]|uniref:Uncharacterized protein n=1 Tax=Exocentrus adspersus TaxID=1586481 RepID=A0AAV8VP45_9CUCU|nr:hypothetical protein NQ315_000662 [Exocentrus adspersus]
MENTDEELTRDKFCGRVVGQYSDAEGLQSRTKNMATFKIQSRHWEVMIEFMEDHRDFATGRVNSLNGKDDYKKLWNQEMVAESNLEMRARAPFSWQ